MSEINNLMAKVAALEDSCERLQAELREAREQARLYLFIAGPALGGTDPVKELATRFPNPYNAFNEAERIRKEELDKLIEICVGGWRQRAETAERLLQEREMQMAGLVEAAKRMVKSGQAGEACSEIRAYYDLDEAVRALEAKHDVDISKRGQDE